MSDEVARLRAERDAWSRKYLREVDAGVRRDRLINGLREEIGRLRQMVYGPQDDLDEDGADPPQAPQGRQDKITFREAAARGRELLAVGRLRPEVRWFAGLMEDKLRENDHKGGWRRAMDAAEELLNELGDSDG